MSGSEIFRTDPTGTGPAGAAPAGGADPTGGVIHDIGFRRYDGPRLGRGAVVRALVLETVRGVFGLGRPARSKVMPWTLIVILLAPPLVIALLILVTGGTELPVSYTAYPTSMQLVIALFVAGAAPYCFSRDLRHRTMPLYLSRPMLRSDYVLAKYAGLTLALLAVLALAQTLLLVGALLMRLDLAAQLTGWAGGLLHSALLAVVAAGVAAVIAALTPRRGLGVAAIITVLLVVSGVVQMLVSVTETRGFPTAATYLPMLDPFALVDGLSTRMLGVASGIGYDYPPGVTGVVTYAAAALLLVTACLAVLVARYRKVGAA